MLLCAMPVSVIEIGQGGIQFLRSGSSVVVECCCARLRLETSEYPSKTVEDP